MTSELTTMALVAASRIYLALAYPNGNPPLDKPAVRALLNLQEHQPLEPLFVPPGCQTLLAEHGEIRGYAFRLGSDTFPHLKLQVIDCDGKGLWVYGVDTHDTLRLDPNHPDAGTWTRMQKANRELKERIEREWEAAGLVTFNVVLRAGLNQNPNLAP